MNRREFLSSLATKAAGGAVMGIAAGCGLSATPAVQSPDAAVAQEAAADADLPEISWQMPTSWPMSLDTIFGACQRFADRVSNLTGGRFTIEPRAAGELAPATQVLDVVIEGAVPIGHTASYYYLGKSAAVAFGTTVPFGLTAQQQNAWLYQGGGLEALQQLYADKFKVIQFPAGNTGAQMGGWFRKEINTIADLQGLKMRIPGLGGQVMAKLGVTVQVLGAPEIFQALQTGAVDAAEWVGPYDDEKLGLTQAAQFYSAPGWWEPGSSLEVQVNLAEWEALPELYQQAIQVAAYETNLTMLAQYEAVNNQALENLVAGGTQLRTYSDEILEAAYQATLELYDEFSADADFKAIYDQWNEFRTRVYSWNLANEFAFTSFVYGKLGR